MKSAPPPAGLQVFACDWSPDGQRVASGGKDKQGGLEYDTGVEGLWVVLVETAGERGENMGSVESASGFTFPPFWSPQFF